VERSKHGFRAADAVFRTEPQEGGATLVTVLDTLFSDLESWASSAMSEETRAVETHYLVEELEPYLVRSPLVSALLRHTSPLVRDPLVAEHLSRPALDSEDGLGNALEAWVRALPGLAVLSRTNAALVEGCIAERVSHSDILVLATGLAHVGRRLVMRLAECTALSDASITLVAEEAADAEQLARFGAGYNTGGHWQGLGWSVANTNGGGAPMDIEGVDVILVPHLLEFLPSRHIVRFLGQLRHLLRPGDVSLPVHWHQGGTPCSWMRSWAGLPFEGRGPSCWSCFLQPGWLSSERWTVPSRASSWLLWTWSPWGVEQLSAQPQSARRRADCGSRLLRCLGFHFGRYLGFHLGLRG
jgi:hypothetical protein